MSGIPNKALPQCAGVTPKEPKSAICREAAQKRVAELQREADAAYRAWGEEAFEVAPLCEQAVDVSFSKERPQTPLVIYNLQCEPGKEAQLFSFVTARTRSGFQVTIHNVSPDLPCKGVMMWMAVVRP